MQWLSKLKRNQSDDYYEIYENVSLSSKTSFRLGGPAKVYVCPRSEKAVSDIMSFSSKEDVPLWVLGGGTNVLVHDDGLPGIVVGTSKLRDITWEIRGSDVYVFVYSGFALPELVAIALKNGWSGLEFAAGIPGTVGGALAGNAGANGRAVGDLVEWVKTVEKNGEVIQWEKNDLVFSYRYSNIYSPDRVISQSCLKLKVSETRKVMDLFMEYKKRRKMQPMKKRTAGCVFKNPSPDMSAGMLLERAGCKGLSKGGACVSNVHANFIEVEGDAKASDVYSLIECCKERVYACFGVSLELEIRLFGGPWVYVE
ncbi:MAG: UDP-N-acetylmuramate dehydrogenase [Thermovirga sp.]|nr:UDP-N-acetylmuramate dehydrogenase [Thermovirga sp.]